LAAFSRRFWTSLLNLDRRLDAARRAYEASLRRYRASARAVAGEARQEFHLELCESVAEMRAALKDLRALQKRQERGSTART
jgi:hypothetical protein